MKERHNLLRLRRNRQVQLN